MPSIREQIQTYIDVRRPAFLDQRLKSLDECWRPDTHELIGGTKRRDVDLSRVVGVFHPNYHGHSWRELCGTPFGDPASSALKRMRHNIANLEENPGYYHGDGEKPGWSFYLVDGELYCNDGVHRMVIGRLLLEARGLRPIVHNVAVDEYRAKPQATLRAQEAQPQPSIWKRIFK